MRYLWCLRHGFTKVQLRSTTYQWLVVGAFSVASLLLFDQPQFWAVAATRCFPSVQGKRKHRRSFFFTQQCVVFSVECRRPHFPVIDSLQLSSVRQASTDAISGIFMNFDRALIWRRGLRPVHHENASSTLTNMFKEAHIPVTLSRRRTAQNKLTADLTRG